MFSVLRIPCVALHSRDSQVPIVLQGNGGQAHRRNGEERAAWIAAKCTDCFGFCIRLHELFELGYNDNVGPQHSNKHRESGPHSPPPWDLMIMLDKHTEETARTEVLRMIFVDIIALAHPFSYSLQPKT